MQVEQYPGSGMGRGIFAPLKRSEREEFEERYFRIPWTGCWLWTAQVQEQNGYGMFRWKLAHRVAYEFYKGPIPKGLHIDHLCRVRSCVNPDHLEAVTPKVNFSRGIGTRNGAIFQSGKTHCVNGHQFNEENTSFDSKNRRGCRVCWRERARRYRKERKNAKS